MQVTDPAVVNRQLIREVKESTIGAGFPPELADELTARLKAMGVDLTIDYHREIAEASFAFVLQMINAGLGSARVGGDNDEVGFSMGLAAAANVILPDSGDE